MAYESLKSIIEDRIFNNTNRGITPTKLREALEAIIDSIGANAQFAGIANSSTNPGTPEQKVFYIFCNETNQSVELPDFGNVTVPSRTIAVIGNSSGSWVVTPLPVELNSRQSIIPVTISVNDWDEDVAEVSVEGVIADDDSQMVQIIPKPSSAEEFTDAGVVCTNQADKSLSFSCTETPDTDIELYVVLTKI